MSQQYVIQARSGEAGNGLASLGTRQEISQQLSHFNTASDGADPQVLHGPGIRIDFPPATTESSNSEQINQMLLTINEEEIGWLVLQRLARELRWMIVDTHSGRAWNP